MPRTWVVDGYNALFRLWDAPPGDRDAARVQLVRRAREAIAGRTDRVHLVFDTSRGAARSGLTGGEGQVSWQYAEGSADDAIVAWLRRPHLAGEDVVVVTDDRELRGRAKQVGARAVRLHDFFDGRATAGESEREPGAPRGPRPPPMRPSDFGLPEGPLDLGAMDPEDL